MKITCECCSKKAQTRTITYDEYEGGQYTRLPRGWFLRRVYEETAYYCSESCVRKTIRNRRKAAAEYRKKYKPAKPIPISGADAVFEQYAKQIAKDLERETEASRLAAASHWWR